MLGSSPNDSSQPQNILVFVCSWTWISSPMTGSQSATRTGEPSKPIACSSACAASRIRFSLNAGPASWTPTGSPSERPAGIEIPGSPASDIGTVQKSCWYMASGSSASSPISKAVVGAAGVTIRSTYS